MSFADSLAERELDSCRDALHFLEVDIIQIPRGQRLNLKTTLLSRALFAGDFRVGGNFAARAILHRSWRKSRVVVHQIIHPVSFCERAK